MKSIMPAMSGSRTLRPLPRWCALYLTRAVRVNLLHRYHVVQTSPAVVEPFVPQAGVIDQNEMFNFALKSAQSVLYSKYKQFGQVCPTPHFYGDPYLMLCLLLARGAGLVR